MERAWERLLQKAETQYSVFSVADAKAEGVGRHLLTPRLERGEIAWMHPGVLRIVGAPRTGRQRAMGVQLWLGERAAISHSTSGRLLRLDAVDPLGVVHASVMPEVSRGRLHAKNVGVHRPRILDESELVIVDGIRCTDAARAVIDIAGTMSEAKLETAIMSAVRLGLTSLSDIADRLARLGPHRPGGPKLRRILEANHDQVLTESALEVLFDRLVRESGLPRPQRQIEIVTPAGRRYRIDSGWPNLRVGVEADGFQWHGERLAWKRDRRRVSDIESCDWLLTHVTWDDVVHHPAQTIARIRHKLELAKAMRSRVTTKSVSCEEALAVRF